MSDVLENQQVLVPIYNAFDRELPESLEGPGDVLKGLLAEVDEALGKLEKLGSQPGATNTAKRAAKLRQQVRGPEGSGQKRRRTASHSKAGKDNR